MGGQLILIRHGIAEERTPEGDDFYRKLTEAGFKPMRMGHPQFQAYLEQEKRVLETTIRKANIRTD